MLSIEKGVVLQLADIQTVVSFARAQCVSKCCKSVVFDRQIIALSRTITKGSQLKLEIIFADLCGQSNNTLRITFKIESPFCITGRIQFENLCQYKNASFAIILGTDEPKYL